MKPLSRNMAFSQNIFPWMLIAGSLFFVLFLCNQLTHHLPKISDITDIFKQTATWQKELDKIESKIKDKANIVRSLDPGPPPAWYWGGSYNVGWRLQNYQYVAAYNALKALYDKKKEIEGWLSHDLWYQTKAFFGSIWTGVIRPVLDVLLLLAIVSFGLRVFLRNLLMRGKLGIVRV